MKAAPNSRGSYADKPERGHLHGWYELLFSELEFQFAPIMKGKTKMHGDFTINGTFRFGEKK